MNEYEYDDYYEEHDYDEPIILGPNEEGVGSGDPEYLYLEVEEHEPENIEQWSYDDSFYESKNGSLCINYARLEETYAHNHNIISKGSAFYTPDGIRPVRQVRQDLHEILKDHGWTKKFDDPIRALITGLQDLTYKPDFEVDPTVIPLADGDLEYRNYMDMVFHRGRKRHTPYRLPVTIPQKFFDSEGFSRYTYEIPERFQSWLYYTFHQDDVETVQDMLGYFMLPTTKAQEMFLIVGAAGAGKSGFKTILENMFGNAEASASLTSMFSSRFGTSVIEGKLVLYDDDLDNKAIENAGDFKKIITNVGKIQVERKGKDPEEINSFVRIICCANQKLKNKFDSSDGFFRRIHPIHVTYSKNRRVDKNFYEKMWKEGWDYILMWSLLGACKLLHYGTWEIHMSQRSKDYLEYMKKSAVTVDDFFEDCCVLGDGEATTAELKEAYYQWSRSNGKPIDRKGDFDNWMAERAEDMRLTKSKHIIRNGRHLRGYKGVRIKDEWK